MSRFRTIELSDPAFEANNLRFVTVKSSNLKGRGDISVFVPPGHATASDLPIVILLHGVYGSSWAWSHSGGVHLTAKKMIDDGDIPPMVIAMPSDGLWGDGSGYLPHDGYDFEKWIVDDVVDVLFECFPFVSSSSPKFISGLSMGGFGALRIGAKYGSLFKGISGHSSITALAQMREFVEEDLVHYGACDSVFDTIAKYRSSLPPLRFDCGVSDTLIEENRLLSKQLSASGIDHIYKEFPGDHGWPYWQEHVKDSLKFFASQLLSS
jgi:S-formylglutathione hydrolase FrmB